MEEALKAGEMMFKLLDLHSEYVQQLEDLEIHKTVNKIRLKESILQHSTDAKDQTDGHSTWIIFTDGM